jgi:hypothetical protein
MFLHVKMFLRKEDKKAAVAGRRVRLNGEAG